MPPLGLQARAAELGEVRSEDRTFKLRYLFLVSRGGTKGGEMGSVVEPLRGMLRLRTTRGLSGHVSSQPKFEIEHS